MDKQTRILLLENAADDIQEAVSKIMEAVRDTRWETYCECYIVAHLVNWAEGTHGIDTTIPKLIQNIKRDKDYDE